MTESGGHPLARSRKGAPGPTQLMPAPAAVLGVDPHDLRQNVIGGATHLANLVGYFSGDVAKALAAYNWGAAQVDRAVERWGEDWRAHIPAETAEYLRRVLGAGGGAGR